MGAQRDNNTDDEHRYRIDNDTGCLIIAVLQIVGGVFGIGVTVYYHVAAPPTLGISLLMAPFVWGIYAGVLLWKGKRRGLTNSIVLQAMQIPRFVIPLIGYELWLGAKLQVGWMGSGQFLDALLGGGASLYFNNESSDLGLGLNLIALAAFLYLRKVKTRVVQADSNAEDIQGEQADIESGRLQPPVD